MGGGASRMPSTPTQNGGLLRESHKSLHHQRLCSIGVLPSGAEKTQARIEELHASVAFRKTNEEDDLFAPPALYVAAGEHDLMAVRGAPDTDVHDRHWAMNQVPLHIAALQGSADCVKLLLDKGAKPGATDTNGLTPLHYAALSPGGAEIFELLLAVLPQATSVNACTANGETPLLFAVAAHRAESVRTLIQHGAMVDLPDCCGVVPLHLAVLAGDEECAAELVKSGATTTLLDDGGKSMQAYASELCWGSERMGSILSGDDIAPDDNELAWVRTEDASVAEEGQLIGVGAGSHQPRSNSGLWSLEDAKEVFIPLTEGSAPLWVATALYSYPAQELNDLGFEQGDTIEVLGTDIPGWDDWALGRIGQRSGFFPLPYVERIEGVAAAATPALASLKESEDTCVTAVAEEDADGQTQEPAPTESTATKAASTVEEKSTEQMQLESLEELAALQKSFATVTTQNAELQKTLVETERRAKQAEAKATAAEAKVAAATAAVSSTASVVARSASSAKELEDVKAEAAALAFQLSSTAQLLTISEAALAAERSRLAASQDRSFSVARRLHSMQHELAVMKLRLKVGERKETMLNDAAAEERKRLAGEIAAMQGEESVAVAHARHVSLASRALVSCQRVRIESLERMCREEAATRRKLYNEVQDAKGNIRVFCRCRPLLPFEVERGDHAVVERVGKDQVRLPDRRTNGKKAFHFSACFDDQDDQATVFAEAKLLIQSVFDGYNVCVFAYGQTGSGKTHTMYGSTEQPGVAPRSVDEIWRHIEVQKTRGTQFVVSVYMAELYLDELRDLLLEPKVELTSGRPKLTVRHDTKGMVVIQNITEVQVNSAAETSALLELGQTRRHVSATSMNAESSRSHLIFAITVRSKSAAGSSLCGKISLVDMAGSERVKRSEVSGQGFKEAVSINKSLSALLDVINALSKNEKSGVPYRAHPLTQVMSDSLGGNAKTLMFVNISPASSNAEESRGALGYATRASTITNNPHKHEGHSVEDAEISTLQKQVLELRKQLQQGALTAR